jgi:hypothetical protein
VIVAARTYSYAKDSLRPLIGRGSARPKRRAQRLLLVLVLVLRCRYHLSSFQAKVDHQPNPNPNPKVDQ